MDCSMPGFPVLLRVCSNSCPLSWWCYLIISSSVISFSSCLQSFPASGSFPMSQLFIAGGQSIGASASASVLQSNIQGCFSLGLTGLIFLQSKGLSRVFSNTTVQKYQCSAFFMVQLSHLYMTTGKTIALTIQDFAKKIVRFVQLGIQGPTWSDFPSIHTSLQPKEVELPALPRGPPPAFLDPLPQDIFHWEGLEFVHGCGNAFLFPPAGDNFPLLWYSVYIR